MQWKQGEENMVLDRKRGGAASERPERRRRKCENKMNRQREKENMDGERECNRYRKKGRKGK